MYDSALSLLNNNGMMAKKTFVQAGAWKHGKETARILESLGATRFRRKLSRPEGMPGATCPQSGGKNITANTELALAA